MSLDKVLLRKLLFNHFFHNWTHLFIDSSVLCFFRVVEFYSLNAFVSKYDILFM